MYFNQKIVLISFFLLILPSIKADIYVNEIMYAPTFNENYNEWIELYNDGQDTYLANWTLCGKILLEGYIDHFDNLLKLNNTLLFPSQTYALITDGGSGTEVYSNFNVSTNHLALHVESASLCTGLSNNGDTIILKNNNGDLIDNVTYSSTDGAKDNQKTLERQFNNSWRESYMAGGTPGKKDLQNLNWSHDSISNETSNKTSNETNSEKNISNNSSFNYYFNDSSLININTSNSTNNNFSNNIISYNTLSVIDFQTDNQKSSLSYEIIEFPNQVYIGDEFKIKVLIKNENSPHKFSVWSYVYSGKKCYSCIVSRDENIQKITLSKNEEQVLTFILNLFEIEEREYNLKIKIVKDDQSTAKELIEIINVKNKINQNQENNSREDKDNNTAVLNNNNNNSDSSTIVKNLSKTSVQDLTANKEINTLQIQKEENSNNKFTGSVVYQSKSRKIKNLIPYFLVLTLVLTLIVFFIK